MKDLLVLAIGWYQGFNRRYLAGSCRYWPSCSEYAVGALERYGVVQGIWLTVCRVLRCHPFAAGGIDPVPEKTS